MNNLLAFFVYHFRTTLTILVFLVVSGVYAYINIAKEENPDIEMPLISIAVNYTGTSPNESETLLIMPLERELSSLKNLVSITSSARQNGGNIQLEFESGTDTNISLNDVKDAITRAKRNLPSDIDEPLAREVSMEDSTPVLSVMLSGLSTYELITVSRAIKQELEKISGVLEVDIVGERKEEVHLLIDLKMLETYNLNIGDIQSMLNRQNRMVAPGRIENGKGRFSLNVEGKISDLSTLLEMPIKENEGQVLRLKEIVTPDITLSSQMTLARFNQQPVISLNIKKKSGENIIETIDQSKQVITQFKQRISDLNADYVNDNSQNIRDMLYDLKNNIMASVFIVFIILLAFLGFKSSLLVSISIPSSFVIGILTLYIFDITLNTMVLFGLIISVGMLVDGAIVVVESAKYHIERGLPKREAYIKSAQKMFFPIFSSTLTTLCAFLPLLFWPGQAGDFMKYLPLTLIAILSSALVVALFFLPAIGGLEFSKHKKASFQGEMNVNLLNRIYIKLVKKCLKYPKTVLFTVIWVCIAIIIGYANSQPRVEFFPNIEPEQITILLQSKGDMSLEERDDRVRKVESQLIDFYHEIESYYTEVRVNPEVFGRITLNLIDWSLRRPSDDIIQSLRTTLNQYPGVSIRISTPRVGPGGSKDVVLEVSSFDKTTLYEGIQLLNNRMENLDYLTDVDYSIRTNGIEWTYVLKRDAITEYGLGLDVISAHLQLFTNGIKVADFASPNSSDLIDIRVINAPHYRTISDMNNFWIDTQLGSMPLSHFIEFKPNDRIGFIRRVDQRESLSITANITEGRNLNDVMDQFIEDISSVTKQYPNLMIQFKGDQEQQIETMRFLTKAFLISVGLMFLILLTQFNSFLQPLFILSAIVFSSVGVMLLLWITSIPFGIIMGGIGIIALAGIVVNNNIVFIDTFNYYFRVEKINTYDAIVKTCTERFRPILLTTITTILGLMPMALQLNLDFANGHWDIYSPSSVMWYQLSLSVVGGLTFAFFITLFVTPCLLYLSKKNKYN